MVCGCHWLQHRHITYEHRTNQTHINSNRSRYSRMNEQTSLADIDQRISDLREEAEKIQLVYRKLARFLDANSILPINNDIVEYLQYFIREEQMKRNGGAQNAGIIAGLANTMEEFKNNMERLKKTIDEEKQSGNTNNDIQPEDIFKLVESLYNLPITGEQIRQQIQGIKICKEKNSNQREKLIALPGKAAQSQMMKRMKTALDS